MKLDQSYKNLSVSTETLDVDELVYNCFGFLRTLPVDPVTAERLQAAEQRLAASIYLNDDLPESEKKNVLFKNIFKILEDISPRGCFFGIHPGDPGNLGFWDNSLTFKTR